MLSVIIPSHKDPRLQKTINSLLGNSELGNGLEIIAVLDGYWPTPQLIDDPRVKILHLGKARGVTDALNAGISIAKGTYIMGADSHCVFGKGYDRILLERIRDNWMVTPRRYFLDTEQWKVTDDLPVDYEKLEISEDGQEFVGREWKSRAEERKEKMVDDTMAMQGGCWVMKRTWWDSVIGKLYTSGSGAPCQDATEMIFKTWRAGGRSMVNKNTWFAHVSDNTEQARNNEKNAAANGRADLLNAWRRYYENTIRPRWKI